MRSSALNMARVPSRLQRSSTKHIERSRNPLQESHYITKDITRFKEGLRGIKTFMQSKNSEGIVFTTFGLIMTPNTFTNMRMITRGALFRDPNECTRIGLQASGGTSSPFPPFFLVLFHPLPPFSSGVVVGFVGFVNTPICLSLVSN